MVKGVSRVKGVPKVKGVSRVKGVPRVKGLMGVPNGLVGLGVKSKMFTLVTLGLPNKNKTNA